MSSSLRPTRLAKIARPIRCACSRTASVAQSEASSSTATPPLATSEPPPSRVPRAGRLPPSPLLQRHATRDNAAGPPASDIGGEVAPLELADVALGSRLSEVLEQGRAVGIEDEGRLRELWTDGWGRMMSGPSELCIQTGIKMPQNLLLTFRIARLLPQYPSKTESMILVPDGILHPDWAASTPAPNGVAPPPPVSIVCCDIHLGRLAGSSSSGPRLTNRALLSSFPHSVFWSADAPTSPVRGPTGATTVSQQLLLQVEHQLQDRIVQEAYLLAERVRAAGDKGMRLLRSVDEDELDRLRHGEAVREGSAAGRSRAMAILDMRFKPKEMASFFADAARNEIISPQMLREGPKGLQARSVQGLPAHSTCPLLEGNVPFFSLQSLLPQTKLDLLVPLLDIIAPASAGSPTRALQTSADLLDEDGLDPFPLFRAVQRLVLFKPETHAWPPEQRRKLWSLVHYGQEEKSAPERKAVAGQLPRTSDGRIDIDALLGDKKLTARRE